MSIDFNVSDNPTSTEVQSAVTDLYKRMSSEINVVETGLFGLMGVSGDNCDIFASMASMLRNAIAAVEFIERLTHEIQQAIANYINMIASYISEVKQFIEDFKKMVATMLLKLLPKGLITILAAVRAIQAVAKYFSSFINIIKNIQGTITEKIKGILGKFAEALDLLSIILCGTAGGAARGITATNLSPKIQNVVNLANAPEEDATVYAMQPVADQLQSISYSMTQGYEYELMKQAIVNKNLMKVSVMDPQYQGYEFPM